MAPDTIECPICHTPNVVSASQCLACATPLPISDATFLGTTDQKPKSPAPKSDSKIELSLDPTPAPRANEADKTFVDSGPATPHNPAATFVPAGEPDRANMTDISGSAGWSKAVSPPSQPALRAGRLAPGTFLGRRYEIVQMLGEGGMGSVYKAKDMELERFVALKVIRPEFAEHEEVLKRFKQELILARKITHKNVIRIFDLGELDGLKFITMEFIEGQDLASLAKEKLPYEKSVDIMYQVCTALDAAHSEGVVHRDLKPQNVMVDKTGRAIVMDFGIARSTEASAGMMTNTGALIGTPDYMSPEQVMGEHVDARSDLFTVGIMLFQLLVGQLPFKADTVQSAMFKRTREQSRKAIEVDPDIPPVLSDIVAKCLALDPANRYQSALEIQADIDAWRGGSTKRITVIEPPKVETVIIQAPPDRRPWIVAGAVVLLLLGGGAFVAKKYIVPGPTNGTTAPAVPLNSLAILPFHNASSDAKLDWLGSSMAEMLSTDVGQSASVRMVSTDRVGQVLKDLRITPQSSLDQPTVGRIANLSNVDTVVWGQYAQFGDQVRIDATIQDLKRGRTTTVKENAASEKEILPAVDRLAAQIREQLSVPKSLQKELQEHAFKPSTASIAALREYDQGLQKLRGGNFADAAKDFQGAIDQDGQFALAYAKLAQSYAELGQDDEAEQAASKAVSLSSALPAQEKYLIQANHDRILKDYPKAIAAYQNLVSVAADNTDYLYELGAAYEAAGTYDKANELFSKVVQLDPKRIEALIALGRVQVKSGDTKKGLEYLTRAQALAIELSDDPGRAQVSQAMGVAYDTLNNPNEALKSLQDALDIRTKLNMKKGIADSLQMMGSIYDETNQLDKALKSYNQALSLRREIGDKQGTANILSDLGDFYVRRGKYDDALKVLKESLPAQIELHNEQGQSQVNNNIGNAYLNKGDYDNARTYFEKALQLREKLKVPSDIADTLHNLGETSMRTGQFDQAQEQYLKALEIRRSQGDTHGAALESLGLGLVFGFQGRLGAAVGAQNDALKGLRDGKETGFWLTEALTADGQALAQAGRSEEAAAKLTEALASANADKSQPQIATIYSYQGDNALYRGDLNAAATAYNQAQQTASKTGDAHLILLTKINAAKLAVAQGKFAAAAGSLKTLGEQADSLGLKYLSTQCLVLRGQALIGMKDYAGAQKDLNTASLRSDKLGLRVLRASSEYQLGRALEASGKGDAAKGHYQEARRAADEVQKEAQNDSVTKRADLAPIFAIKAA
jgi:eukaryotic-like serine/threonine-protein kinase